MKLAAYVRVSTLEQVEHGAGLDIQHTAITRWAKANGHRIVASVADEGVSGTKGASERPGLADALGMLFDRKVDGLVIRDLGRLARDLTTQEAILAEVWRRPDAHVFTVHGEVLRDDPDDPMRTTIRQIVGAFAELDRKLVVKRMRDGRAAKAARGLHATGSYPYGLTKNGVDPAEQKALARMRALAAAGESTRSIAATLTAENHPTRRGGGRWTSPVVARILSRANAERVA